MFRLHYANRTEALTSALAEHVAARSSPLVPLHVVVPNRHVERYLEMRLAEATGIASNLRFHRLERFVRSWLLRETGETPLDRRTLEGGALAVLLDEVTLTDPQLAPLVQYLDAAPGPGARDARRAQLASRLAALLEAYAFSRPELLEAWRRGRSGLPDEVGSSFHDTEQWQRALFAEIRARVGRRPLPELLQKVPSTAASSPTEVHVFGLSYVAPVYTWALALLGEVTELFVYTLNPCMEFWEDVPTPGELRARLPRRASTRAAERFEEELALSSPEDPPALTHWGRPGREHVRMLNDLTGAEFEPCFVVPEAQTLLGRFQQDVLLRRTPGPEDERLEPDGSIEAIGCAGVRRELETVAEAIWAQVRADPTLRFNDIAVLVPQAERQTYLPHLSAVFLEARDIPHHVVDLPLTTESRVVEAATMLVDLPAGDFRRPEVLALLTHPVLRVPGTRGEPSSRAEWVALVDRLGIFHGLDRRAHASTYVEGDLLNWDQGARRLTLGAFMTGERSRDVRAFQSRSGEAYLPEEAANDDRAPALALLIRALTEDVRFAREAELTLREWSTFFAGMFRGYLAPRDAREESELRRCLAAAEALSDRELSESQHVGFRLAAELLRADLAALGGSRGDYLADGVVVSALAPMRAIPFRTVFVLGLGEGRFPTTERRDPMDLRAARRRIGDVTPAERDRYIFLEALLGARDRFVVSWVSRDPLTGDAIAPSTVVVQLLDALTRDYVAEGADLGRQASLRRHEEAGPDDAFAEAFEERRAATAGGESSITAMRQDPEMARLFALAPLPDRADEDGELRVSLSALRRFLEDPAQGWARAVLRLDDFGIESRASREDEPLDAERLAAATTLRASFVDALTNRRAPSLAYAEEAARLAAHGRWPVGVLGEHRRTRDAAVLDAWKRAYSNAVATPGPPTRIRFGDGLEPGEAAELRPPLSLDIDLGGVTRRVQLVGRTEALVDGGRASMVLVHRAAKLGSALLRERLRYGLRGYVDHLALSASGRGGAHRALVLFGGNAAREASTHFAEVDPAHARAILSALVADLWQRTHAYFLPSDAVFRCAPRWRVLTEEMLEKALRQAHQDERGSWRYGPVPHPERLPFLAIEEAVRMAQRRYDEFFTLAGMGRSSGEGVS